MRSEPEQTLYSLDTAERPGPAEVGGKGASLIEMTRAGLPVPPGFVLTTAFFRPWLEQLRATAAWRAFAASAGAEDAADEELRTRAAELAAAGEDLAFTAAQQRGLSEALAELPGPGPDPGPADGSRDPRLLAVRSSAPQEDLSGASFAGVYDTVLGVAPADLAAAVRAVFLSGMGFPAVSYKRRRGFDPTRVEIAVVVQRQLDSASAGVAFSLNPQSNDYDEAVIHANWGLGETVVSGAVTPDRFVVDKATGRVVDVRPGAKETALWSRPEGGSAERPGEQGGGSGRCSLTRDQAAEVARAVQRVEALTSAPVDVEWAYTAGGELSLLQARPVTTYFPLPEELLTAPEEPRRLYLDSTLLEEGLQEPLSVLGERWMEDAIVEMVRQVTGLRVSTRDAGGLILTVGGRWYLNASNILWLGTERLARSVAALDVHAARTLRNVDARRYRKAAAKPQPAGAARAVAGTAARSGGLLAAALAALTAPRRARRRYAAAVDRHRRHLAGVARTARSLPRLGEEAAEPAVRLLVREGLPLTAAAETAASLLGSLYRRASDEQRRNLGTALRSMPGNVTIDMGLELYDLARSLEESAGPQAYSDIEALARRLVERDLPESFLRRWDAFLADYGFRGPDELDLAAPRYADDPRPVLEQLRHYVLLDESAREAPRQAYERRQRERRAAYDRLLAGTRNPVKAWLVRRLYPAVEELGGLREIHKYQLVRAGYLVRRRALETGRELAAAGRLDSAEQVFELDYADLAEAAGAAPVDLRARARRNTRYRRRVRHLPGVRFPVAVDSRGRIPRPAARAPGPGVLAGEAVSPGVASGPAKVLRHAGEKPVLPGEVLVARATDPGWTPLFVNAAGIVLETGGGFQHGALVAREYGKPCLVGVEDATRRITDGQLVELDGASGTLTVVSDPAKSQD
ncbi:PEP/pyruvate-binding domain-containing protein [Streptomonospora sp. PA3]|uniref:PEP/pyruvate-binding domain-containing protein n=1 Tax=Streptomonospora sp. PA3 TaxID=2607326 RepID=UPI0016433FD3|nr:PEP/pyruvate-binding domain-containing protein [Streptomonospora sp. PA3]